MYVKTVKILAFLRRAGKKEGERKRLTPSTFQRPAIGVYNRQTEVNNKT